jgi:hypothetical protein
MNDKHRNIERRVSISLTVLAAVAFSHPGAALAQTQGDDAVRLLVDRDHGRLGGQCTESDPCARITDALNTARAMRYGLDPAIPKLAPHKRITISVRASATPYLGSPDPLRLAANPNLEALPLFVNISDLDLIGETKFTRGEEGWIDENSTPTDATVIKSEAPLVGNLALILIGVTPGMAPDDVTVRGFVLDGNTPVDGNGFLIVADRAQRFQIRDTRQSNATYGVAAEGSTGAVEGCFMTKLGEGVLVFGGNSTWPAEITVRDTRSIENAFGGLVFFGSAFAPNSSFPPLADFGAYTGVFQPVPFSGADITVGHVIHNDLGRNTASLNSTSGLRMALIGPNLPPEQSAGNLFMNVSGNRLNGNAHAFIIDAGFPFRASSTDFAGLFIGLFEGNEATGSLTAKALVTFTRNNAAETLPGSMAAWKYLANSRYQVFYSSGEFEPASGSSDRVWIDNPSSDPGDASRMANNELVIKSR